MMYQFSEEAINLMLSSLQLKEGSNQVVLSNAHAHVITLLIKTHVELVERINGNFTNISKEA